MNMSTLCWISAELKEGGLQETEGLGISGELGPQNQLSRDSSNIYPG